MPLGALAKKYVVPSAVRWLVSSQRRADSGGHVLQEIVNKLDRLTVRAQDMQRLVAAAQRNVPSEIFSFDRARLSVSVRSPDAPWLSAVPAKVDTPAMITHEEAQYFTYLGSFYEGRGRVVELGPWLGASTQHIVLSLANNPRFAGEQLYVFDDFTWRKDWMDQYVSEAERLAPYACFRHLFEKYTAGVRHFLNVERVKITDYDGNERLPILSWCGDPIEILYVDCGRTYHVNAAWFSHLKSSLIPGRTLIVMQDWGTHREVPRKSWNQTLTFTESNRDALLLIHEVQRGTLATFLFTGKG
jgi:hypothetical protein